MKEHRFKSVTIQLGDSVEFEFEDGRRFVKNFGVKRSLLQSASMRKGGRLWKFRDGTEVLADNLYAEMENAQPC